MLSALRNDDKIAWYANDRLGTFVLQQTSITAVDDYC
jgi:hypothetical protein